MSEIPEQFIAEARELLAVEWERRELRHCARHYRMGLRDDCIDVTTLARVLFERQQPTFEQRVEAFRRAVGGDVWQEYDELPAIYDRAVAEIMRPKVDPLAEAWSAAFSGNSCACYNEIDQLRKALAARGLEIVAKGDA